ncbi:uncharacterized protein LOC143250811 isoform X2 [Tachypleus tridentatus]
MEKRRRARINQCLTELKTLVLDALREDPSRHSKLEKADILDMTVKHLQNVQRQQVAAAIVTDPTVLSKFKAGFSECASEVTRYLNRIGIEKNLRQRLLNHLGNCISSLQTPTLFSIAATTGTASTAFPGMNSSVPDAVSHFQPMRVQIPSNIFTTSSDNIVPPRTLQNVTVDINNNVLMAPNSATNPSTISDNFETILGSLSLIPSRLPNGDIAFLLPRKAFASVSNDLPNNIMIDSRTTDQTNYRVSTSNTATPSFSFWDHSLSPENPRRHSSLSCVPSPCSSDSSSEVFAESLMGSPKESSPYVTISKIDHSSQNLSSKSPSVVQDISLSRFNTSVSTLRKKDVQSTIANKHRPRFLSVECVSSGYSTINHMENHLTISPQRLLTDKNLVTRQVGIHSEHNSTFSSSCLVENMSTHKIPSVHHQPGRSSQGSDNAVWRPW